VQSLRRPPNFFQSPNPPNYKPLPSIVLQGLLPALLPYRRIGDKLDEMQSPENLAAHIAPHDDKSALMQRMEDSSLRQLWQLTHMLFKVRKGALAEIEGENEGTSGDMYENKGHAT